MMRIVSLYEAETHLSSLIEAVAEGEEIVITENGVPRAKLVPVPVQREPRQPAHAIGITYIAGAWTDERPIASWQNQLSMWEQILRSRRTR